MSRSVTEFEAQIQSKIADNTGGTVTTSDIIYSLNRCKNELQSRYGIYATKNTSVLSLFPSVHEYPLPSDYHDFTNVQVKGEPRDFLRTTPDTFWAEFNSLSDVVAIDAIRGTRFLLIKASDLAETQVIHDCESLTGNGTWAAEASTDATNVVLEDENPIIGSGAISFDVSVGLSGNDYAAIQNSTFTAVDLSDFADKGTIFVYVDLPSVTNLTSFTLRWGSDSGNYYSQTVTTQFNGLGFQVGRNRLGFAWSGSTETGTVTDTAIDYLNLRMTYSASFTSQTNIIVDDIRIENPTRMELRYYSTSFVQDGDDDSYKANFVSANDTSLLQDVEDDVLFYFALADALDIMVKPDKAAEARAEFEKSLSYLRSRYGSEKKREITFYR
jgi:hypothetical protein